MVTWEVLVEGTAVDALVDVKPKGSDEGNLARAQVVCGNTPANRAIQSADEVLINKNGTEEFDGSVVKKPTTGDKGDFLELVVADERAELFYEEVHRPFYDMDTGTLVEEAILQRAQTLNSVTVHAGDESGSEWDSDVPVFEKCGFTSKRYRDRGTDLIFCGWREGASGEYSVTYDSVPAAAIPGEGQISRLKTRLLANNTGDQIKGELELTDNAGKTYVWTLPRLNSNFETFNLRAEDATTSASIGSVNGSPGTLEYRFALGGELSEPRAVLIDYAETLPFSLESRNTSLTATGVQTTGRTINRRYDATIMELLNELSEEDGFTSYVEEDDLKYEPSGQTVAPKSIDFDGGTPVVDYSVERDYDRIVNKLTVQGSGDIQVTVQDNASIEFYGLSPREEQLVDKEIQTSGEAQQRGEQILDSEAWHESALSFSVADSTFSDVRVGEAIQITWPPDDVDGEFIVSGKEIDNRGIVTLTATGSTET